MATFLCTYDTFVAGPKSILSSERAIKKILECRDCQFLLSDFKDLGVSWEGSDIVLSQLACNDNKGKVHKSDTVGTKLDLHGELTDEEANEHRTAAGRPAWIGPGTSSTPGSLPSMAAQGKKKTVALFSS